MLGHPERGLKIPSQTCIICIGKPASKLYPPIHKFPEELKGDFSKPQVLPHNQIAEDPARTLIPFIFEIATWNLGGISRRPQ